MNETNPLKLVDGFVESVPQSWDSTLLDYKVIVSLVRIMIELEDCFANPGEDPNPKLVRAIEDAVVNVESFHRMSPHFNTANETLGASLNINHTKELFESAWTTYSPETYEHSVELVRRRLKANNLDENFFKGKICWDGGCGTGRLAVAIAEFGASKVVAADIGGVSLEFFKKVCDERGLKNIEIIEQDVTQLSDFKSNEFDFVASNGVLHHTENCDRGLKEHFRITKPNGMFWVYLYGAGGIYWPIYDALRNVALRVPIDRTRSILRGLGLREGLIYTYLDNFLAPRVYYTRKSFLDLFPKTEIAKQFVAKGVSAIDDIDTLLHSNYGPYLMGDEGEIRHVIIKK